MAIVYNLGKLLDKDAPEGTKAYEVLETYKGSDLEYKEYEPLFDCAKEIIEKQHKKAHYIVCDTYVTMTDGTGIVHIAPAGIASSNITRFSFSSPFTL